MYKLVQPRPFINQFVCRITEKNCGQIWTKCLWSTWTKDRTIFVFKQFHQGKGCQWSNVWHM